MTKTIQVINPSSIMTHFAITIKIMKITYFLKMCRFIFCVVLHALETASYGNTFTSHTLHLRGENTTVELNQPMLD